MERDPELVVKMEAETVECSFTVPRVKLGSQGLEVSKLGLGCYGFTGSLSTPAVAEEAAIAVIKEAFDQGVTFFDTADFYGQNKNEVLIGKALEILPREKIQLATKFGLGFNGSEVVVNGSPEYVRACCEGSLQRLGVDYIDLYYQHRVDLNVPIEDTVGEMKKLVEEGKVKYIGLSEASADTIRRAHAVHPITAVQMEWSLWTRDIEEEIVPLCRNLGIGIVAYSPLGIGFFGGKAENSSAKNLLRNIPRFSGDNLDKNMVFYARVANLAAKHGCTPAQLAVAWLLHQGDDVVPIPGTTKIKNLIDNIGSVNVKLTEDDLKEISDALPIDQVAGYRTQPVFAQYDWQFAGTPPKKSADQLDMPGKP